MRRLGSLVAALVLIALAAAGVWFFRGQLGGAVAEPAEVSPEAAASAEAKLERLREHGETVRLSGIELSSLLRYSFPDAVPNALREPSVALAGDTVRLTGRLAADELPDVKELNAVRGFLPDTTRVDVTGRLQPLEGSRSAFEIAEVLVAGVPIPSRFYANVLDRIGRQEEPGLAENAIAFRLPPGVGGARVEDGYLVLIP